MDGRSLSRADGRSRHRSRESAPTFSGTVFAFSLATKSDALSAPALDPLCDVLDQRAAMVLVHAAAPLGSLAWRHRLSLTLPWRPRGPRRSCCAAASRNIALEPGSAFATQAATSRRSPNGLLFSCDLALTLDRDVIASSRAVLGDEHIPFGRIPPFATPDLVQRPGQALPDNPATGHVRELIPI